MNRKKVILSIILLVVFVLAAIILPALWRSNNKKQVAQTARTESNTEKDSSGSEITALEFQNFDQLDDFFSNSQIRSLKAQCIAYLLTVEKGDLTSITFQPDQTSYLDKNIIHLVFDLSDDTSLPVTYSTPTGAFYFGEEQLKMEIDTTIFEQETDDSLPSLTTDEIEVQQEGGYADTKDNKEVQP